MMDFDTVIIGGGIVGSGIFRDLSLHGIHTLLIDKNDFSARTSQKSSKMLHGGIRYLENLDFPLVYEALYEKNLWLKIAPHLCFEEKFYLPVYSDAKRPLWMIKAGLFLYDLLSLFKNTPHEVKSKNETLTHLPLLKSDSLSGSGIYCDAIVDDAKMTLELIYDGLLNPTSKALNYHELISHEVFNHHHLLEIKNTITQEVIHIKCRHVVYALGPYTDKVIAEQKNKKLKIPWTPLIAPSKGSHLWFSKKDFPLESPVVMTPSDQHGDRVIFVIPQNDLVLVGTTEVKVTQDPAFDPNQISEEERDYLLSNLQNYFPQANLSKEKIVGSFAGIRPLALEGASESLGQISREHKIRVPYHHFFIIAGGKYTTFRVMGQEISSQIVLNNQKNYRPDLGLHSLSIPSIVKSFYFKIPSEKELLIILKNEMPKTFEDLVNRRMGILTKKMWAVKTNQSEKSFDDYFLKHLPLLEKYIKVTKEDIFNY